MFLIQIYILLIITYIMGAFAQAPKHSTSLKVHNPSFDVYPR